MGVNEACCIYTGLSAQVEKNQSVYHEIRLRCFAVTLNRLFMLINSFLSLLSCLPYMFLHLRVNYLGTWETSW